MDAVRSFHAKLRSLARTLDGETARLQRALDGEDGDFEDYPMRILYDLHSEVQVLKADISILLDKARLESQESIGFIKATKVLMKKNSADIMKIREFFQKYGYKTPVKENSVRKQEVTDCGPDVAPCEGFQQPGGKDDQFSPCALSSSASEKPPPSPQLSDFGLERYMISQVLPNPPQAASSQKEECTVETPPVKEALVQVPKTPKCTLKMDDFECVTPKLEHFGISEYTMCLNEDYTMRLKNVKIIKSEEATGTEPVISDQSLSTPGPVIQQLEKSDVEWTNSPLAPIFCTPGLKIPSAKTSAALVSTSYPLSKANSSSVLEVKDCTQLILNSDECCETFVDPSTNSYENLLGTPTPPEITAIPEDILQIFSKHNSNLATPAAVKAVLPRKRCLAYEGQSTRGASNKENW